MSTAGYTLEQLVDILSFKVEVMNQMPLASTLLAVLAMTVVAVLVAGPERGRLRSVLLVVLTASTLLFIFGTMLDVCILPAMKRNATHSNAAQIRMLLDLSEVVVWALLVGSVLLFGGVGALGFVYSRRVGLWTMAVAGVIAGVFTACCFYLDNAMNR